MRVDKCTILNLHALLADELLAEWACGSLRSIPVSIGGSVYIPPGIPQVVAEGFQQVLDIAGSIRDPFEQAFFLMIHLPYLQPFEDVNKRVSRLAADIPLIRGNLYPLSFVDVPEQLYVNGLIAVYEINRMELLRELFVWAYERSSSKYKVIRHTLGEPDPFRIKYRVIRKETVAFIVRQGLDKQTACQWIQKRALELPVEDRSRFSQVVEEELLGLHEGNMSRYGLKESEVIAWHRNWK